MSPPIHLAIGLLVVIAAAGWGWALTTGLGRAPSRDADRILAYPIAGLLFLALVGSVLWVTGGFTGTVAWALALVGGGLAAFGIAGVGRSAWLDLRASPLCRPWSGILWCGAIAML
ncbi:MAG: hypothetical protein ACE5GW_09385, partial [Planctomycetota bacterium]